MSAIPVNAIDKIKEHLETKQEKKEGEGAAEPTFKYKERNPLGSRKYKQSRHSSRLKSGEKISHAIPPSLKNIIRGQKDSYTIKYNLNRIEAEAILKETGFEVPFPPGQDKLSDFVLGRGGFGEFCIGFNETAQRYVGIKIPKRSNPMDIAKKELAIYHAITDKGLRHILPMLDFHEAWDGSDIRLYQVMPLAGLGSVDKFMPGLHLFDKQLKEQIVFCLAEGFIEGLAELHAAGIYHLDLKPDNIVVQGAGDIFLIDFGCSAQSDDGMVPAESEGDTGYYSKERWLSFCGIDFDGAKADAFAAGLTLLMLWDSQYSHKPVDGCLDELWNDFDLGDLSGGQFLEALRHGEYKKRFEADGVFKHLSSYAPLQSPEASSIEALIAGLLHSELSRRLTPKEALNHPWMQKMRAGASFWRDKVRAHLREFIQSEQREQRSLGPQDLPLPHFTNFVERGAIQEQIVQRLLKESYEEAIITLCQGRGGVGKTQLLSFILHLPAIQNHFGVKLWFRDADKPNLLDVHIVNLARELQLIDEKAEVKVALERFHSYLAQESKKTGKPWLIVFDNAEEEALLKPYLPPQGGHCLITTQNPDWRDVHIIAVNVLSESEALMLSDRLFQKREPEALNLCRALEFLPFSIVQAQAYITAESLTILQYLEQLQKESSAVVLLEQNKPSFGKKLPTSVLDMLAITFRTLSSRYPEALSLLNKLAYLSPDAIPQSLLNALGKLENQTILQKYAMLQINAQGLSSMHGLLQLAVRVTHEKEAQATLLAVMKTLYNLYHWQPETLDAIKANTQLLAHGVAVSELAVKRLDSMDDLQESLADTLSWLGALQGEWGLPSQARKYHERALAIKEKIYGEEHPSVAISLNNLGSAFDTLGDTKKAVEYYERALAMNEKTYGKEHPSVAISLNNLGLAFDTLGDTKKAVEYYERALAIREKSYGKEHPLVATSLNNLGAAFDTLGDTKKAVEYYERALAMNEKTYGKEHPSVAISLNNLGEAFGALGDAKKAVEYYERALAMNEKIYGEEHPSVAISLNNLGGAFETLGDAKKAVEYYERALSIKEKTYGKEHPSVAISLNNLGEAFGALGDAKKAVEYYERALSIKEKTYGKEHPSVAISLNNLGEAFRVLGDAKKAVEYHECALAIYEKFCGKEHPDVATILNNLGEAFYSQGDTKKAVEYYERMLAIDEKIYGKESTQVKETRESLEFLRNKLVAISKSSVELEPRASGTTFTPLRQMKDSRTETSPTEVNIKVNPTS